MISLAFWNTSAEFVILAVEPVLLKQVGQDLVDPDRIELIPQKTGLKPENL